MCRIIFFPWKKKSSTPTPPIPQLPLVDGPTQPTFCWFLSCICKLCFTPNTKVRNWKNATGQFVRPPSPVGKKSQHWQQISFEFHELIETRLSSDINDLNRCFINQIPNSPLFALFSAPILANWFSHNGHSKLITLSELSIYAENSTENCASSSVLPTLPLFVNSERRDCGHNNHIFPCFQSQ